MDYRSDGRRLQSEGEKRKISRSKGPESILYDGAQLRNSTSTGPETAGIKIFTPLSTQDVRIRRIQVGDCRTSSRF